MFTTGGGVSVTTADEVVDGADGVVPIDGIGVIGVVIGVGKTGVPVGVEAAVAIDCGMVFIVFDTGFLMQHLGSAGLAKASERKKQRVVRDGEHAVPDGDVAIPDCEVLVRDVVRVVRDCVHAVPDCEHAVQDDERAVPDQEHAVQDCEHTVRQHAWVSHHPDLLPDWDARRARRLSLSLN